MKTAIHFCRTTTPLGAMLLVAADDALRGVYFEGQRYFPVLAADWRASDDHTILLEARTQLAQYFAGERARFELPIAPQGTPFQRAVWSAICSIPAGETISYSELAARAGKPDCIRAAGAATGRNPLTLVVPCHRVVGSNGALTGYAGGLERKRALLSLEAKHATHGLFACAA